MWPKQHDARVYIELQNTGESCAKLWRASCVVRRASCAWHAGSLQGSTRAALTGTCVFNFGWLLFSDVSDGFDNPTCK